ncbi:MAG: S-layer homology domain-containing protein [Eubacteriales bacterium]
MKRALSVLLSLLLAFSCVAASAAATFADAATHWALPAIEYMVGKKILSGYEDGTFRPERTVTRAEYIKMLDETFGLTAQTSISYTDVAESDWFYPYVAKAAAQGYLLNYGSSLNPNGTLSRQEAAALLVRYLDLDADAKASPSTYADYTTIKTAYRDYVLQATEAKLFQGIREDDGSYTFRPDKTLTRAEALTILSRAAGTIYRGSQNGTDADAASSNGVITQSGVTISDAVIGGTLIISEGASGGVITLSGCTVGNLILRGTASVVLSDCVVESMTVDSSVSGYTASVSLLSGSQISEAELRTPADISLASRTQLGTLTVQEDARRSSVSGSGKIELAKINASGFVSDQMPTRYELAKGITATLAGTSCSGASASGSQSGFTATPSTYASSSNCYLTATAAAAGTVYYYFTTSSAVPTSSTFNSYYNVSSVHASYTATANLPRDTNIGTTANVGAYPYLVLMLVDSAGNRYQPLVIANKASSGFTVAPSVSVSGAYQYLSYTPTTAGTLYYYYTNSSAALTISSFTNAYNALSAGYKGTMSAAANQSASNPMQRASDVAAYSYIAVLLTDTAGEQYQPLVIPVQGGSQSASGTGFSSAPVCADTASGITLTFTASQSGTLQYYFSSSSVVPTSAQFDTNLAMVGSSLTGSRSVDSGRPYTALLTTSSTATSYPYVVLRLSTATVKYQPVVVKMTASSSVNLSGSGFTSMPTLSISNGYYYITLPTSSSATVYYYLTNASSIANSTIFMTNYNAAINTPYQATKTGGVLTTSGYYQSALQTIIPSSMYGSYSYLALMVTTGMQNCTPIVIPLTGSASTSTTDTGFLTGPVYNIYYSTRHQIEFSTTASGKVYYYYTDTSEVTTAEAENMIGQILFGSLSGSELAGYVDVSARSMKAIPISADSVPPYVILIFVGSDNTVHKPVVLPADGSSSNSLSTGFNGTPTLSMQSGKPVLNYSTNQSGKIYYYFTNSSSIAGDTNSFLTTFINSPYTSGTIDTGVGMGIQELTTQYSVSGYSYVVLMFQSASGGTGGYYRPIVISTSGSSGSSGSSISSGSGFAATPTLSVMPWGGSATLTFTPTMTGTLYYSYTNENTTSAWLEPVMTLIGIGGGTSTGSSLLQNPQQLSQMIALYGTGKGGSQAVSAYGTQQSVALMLNTGYKYLVVWIANSSKLSTPVFLPITGSSTGSGTGSMPWTTGFSADPTYNPYYSFITFTPSVSGNVRYVFSNSTSIVPSVSEFEQMYSRANYEAPTTCGSTSVSAGTAGYLNVPKNYKYAWIMLTSSDGTSYMPCSVQVSN